MGSSVRDYRHYANLRERNARRRVQDARDAARHRDFDLSARDNHMKYERLSFAVVTASDAFRAGYDQIRWDSSPQAPSLESKPAQPANEAK